MTKVTGFLEGRGEDTSPELNHLLGAKEMQRTSEVMQEAARDFLVAAERLEKVGEVLTTASLSLSQSLDRLELCLDKIMRMR